MRQRRSSTRRTTARPSTCSTWCRHWSRSWRAEGVTDTRPVFFRIGDTGELIFYVLAAVTVALFVNGVWRRVRKYRRGRSAHRWDTIKDAVFRRPTGGVRGGRGDHGSVAVIASNVTVGRRNRAVGLAH